MSHHARMVAAATTACLVALTTTTTIAIAQGNSSRVRTDTASTDKARPATPPNEIAEVHDVATTVMVPHAGAETERMALGPLPRRQKVFPTTVASWHEQETPPNKERRVVQLEALGGVTGLINTDNNDTAFTVLDGVGVRGLYGFTGNVSLTAGLALTSTGDARFANTTTARATAGRALLGAVVMVGERYTPYVQAGLGARLSRYTIAPPGGTPLRVGSLMWFGGGLDAWLGNSLVVGASANYVGPLDGANDSVSFELWLHVGYAWKPWYL